MNLVVAMGVRSRWVSTFITDEHPGGPGLDVLGGLLAAARNQVREAVDTRYPAPGS